MISRPFNHQGPRNMVEFWRSFTVKSVAIKVPKRASLRNGPAQWPWQTMTNSSTPDDRSQGASVSFRIIHVLDVPCRSQLVSPGAQKSWRRAEWRKRSRSDFGLQKHLDSWHLRESAFGCVWPHLASTHLNFSEMGRLLFQTWSFLWDVETPELLLLHTLLPTAQFGLHDWSPWLYASEAD